MINSPSDAARNRLSVRHGSAYGAGMPSSARSAAREAEANPAFRVAARAGSVADGILPVFRAHDARLDV